MYDIQSWYKAIPARHSVRAYKTDPVPKESLAAIAALSAGFSPLCTGARAHIIERDADDIFVGLIGPFVRATGAPSAIVFTVDAGAPHHMESAGYLGEGMVLEATSLGLRTCWIAGAFSRPAVAERLTAERLTMEESWRVVAVTPLGFPAEVEAADHRIAKLLAHSRSRKPLADIVSGLPQEKCPGNLDRALEAARWAPSSANRQPWRFVVSETGVTLSSDAPSLPPSSIKRLDCGIAMLHFEVAARALGLAGKWQFSDGPELARFEYS